MAAEPVLICKQLKIDQVILLYKFLFTVGLLKIYSGYLAVDRHIHLLSDNCIFLDTFSKITIPFHNLSLIGNIHEDLIQ